jgi:hypothetical protein
VAKPRTPKSKTTKLKAPPAPKRYDEMEAFTKRLTKGKKRKLT